jgi:hypothetical protein
VVSWKVPKCIPTLWEASRLAQHPQDGREWLPGEADRIHESPAVEVIVLRHTRELLLRP